MKSLFERALARPYHSAGLVIAALAVLAALWWLFCPQASTENALTSTSKTVTNISTAQLPAQAAEAASAITATSEITATETAQAAITPVEANTALPTDPALAEEELDRLKDEHARLKERKAQLAQQLEISNKLLAMKEQQLKTFETTHQ